MELFSFLLVIGIAALYVFTSYKKFITNKKFLESIGVVEVYSFRLMKNIAQSKSYSQASSGGMLAVIDVLSYFFIAMFLISIFLVQIIGSTENVQGDIRIIICSILFLLYIRWGNITTFEKTLRECDKMVARIVKWKGIPFLIFFYYAVIILPFLLTDDPNFKQFFTEESIAQIELRLDDWFVWALPFFIIVAIIAVNVLIYYSLWGFSRGVSAVSYYLTSFVVRLAFHLNKRKPWLPIIFMYTLVSIILSKLIVGF